ncbi:hypothetical protein CAUPRSCDRAFT_12676 [Caulochytrium protostelioides]|uniref:Uncharacterized protein n=1 Tax=Caulochytrium protostelioides TaxID=1555241 RepID=A0A4P9WRB6_9FUNG|nr:hypothetical protein CAUPRSCDRAFT_12676 [Caulochytrium protostelioides]
MSAGGTDSATGEPAVETDRERDLSGADSRCSALTEAGGDVAVAATACVETGDSAARSGSAPISAWEAHGLSIPSKSSPRRGADFWTEAATAGGATTAGSGTKDAKAVVAGIVSRLSSVSSMVGTGGDCMMGEIVCEESEIVSALPFSSTRLSSDAPTGRPAGGNIASGDRSNDRTDVVSGSVSDACDDANGSGSDGGAREDPSSCPERAWEAPGNRSGLDASSPISG